MKEAWGGTFTLLLPSLVFIELCQRGEGQLRARGSFSLGPGLLQPGGCARVGKSTVDNAGFWESEMQEGGRLNEQVRAQALCERFEKKKRYSQSSEGGTYLECLSDRGKRSNVSGTAPEEGRRGKRTSDLFFWFLGVGCFLFGRQEAKEKKLQAASENWPRNGGGDTLLARLKGY